MGFKMNLKSSLKTLKNYFLGCLRSTEAKLGRLTCTDTCTSP